MNIGPYEIICELGQGGMAKVFRALQPSVNRVIALKVLPSQLETDPTSVARFRQEAETAANLAHENIVKVWDASINQPPYHIAMEFLEGGTLSDRIESGPLPVGEAVKIMIAVCSALEHAHQRGVVHRDIKPANIMFDGKNRPVVTDFGIARAASQTRLTATGASFGTPDYMSPEQARGAAVDHHTDIYSLGVVLYEMLTGRPPFISDSPLVTMRQIIDDPVPPPSLLNPLIPKSLESVVLKALAKAPEARYQSGAAFADDLWLAYQSPEKFIPSTDNFPTETLASTILPGTTRKAVPLPTPREKPRKFIILALVSLVVIALALFYLISHGTSTPNDSNTNPPNDSPKSSASASKPDAETSKPITAAPGPAAPSAGPPVRVAPPHTSRPKPPVPKSSPPVSKPNRPVPGTTNHPNPTGGGTSGNTELPPS